MDHVKIITKLCDAGFPAHIVGGAVRDFLDGEQPHDFDIVTKATPEEILNVFKGYSVKTVGKSFGVVLVEGYEVATYRVDRYPGEFGAKNCVPTFADTLEEDLSRRDLTVNQICLCPISGDIVDEFNGITDLKNRVVRFIGNPNDRIVEDPARIIRACRFVGKLQGTFETKTLMALQSKAHLINTVAKERIQAEILKAMELPYPSYFFAALQVIGGLEHIFPTMSKAVGHVHGKWHKETIWEHLMISGDKVSRKYPLVRLAAFLHDVGKPSAYDFNKDGSFVNHENVGANMVTFWLKRLKFSKDDIDKVSNLVRFHMLGGGPDFMSPKAIRKLQKKFADNNVDFRDFLRVRIADRSGNLLKPEFTLSEIKDRYKMFESKLEEKVFDVNSLVIKGGDLIQRFKLTPGPIVGKLQKHLLEFVIENGFEFNTEVCLEIESRNFLEDQK